MIPNKPVETRMMLVGSGTSTVPTVKVAPSALAVYAPPGASEMI
jgi:hypothetical protein